MPTPHGCGVSAMHEFHRKTCALVNFESRKMSLTSIGKVSRVYSVPHAGHAALTIFTQGKEGTAPTQETGGGEERRTDLSQLRPEISAPHRKFWLLRTRENTTVAPPCRQVNIGSLNSEKGQSTSISLCGVRSDTH